MTVADDPSRPGPDPVEADTWESEPAKELAATSYAGRHHSRPEPARIWLAIAVALLCLGIAVAVPLSLTDPPVTGDGGSALATLDLSSAVTGDSSTPDVGNALATSFGPSAPPSVGPTLTPAGTPAPSTAARPAVTTSTTSRPPAFPTVTIEAEAGGSKVTLGGSAWIWGYSGASNGQIARNIGNWGMSGGPGTLRVNDVTFTTTSTYVITLYFVHPDGERNRSAQLTVSGVTPVTVAFSGSSDCCSAKAVNIAVPAGNRTITISNSTGHAPSIDKIAISRL